MKTNRTMSFQERAKLGMEQLSKQAPVTLSMARNQVARLKARRAPNDNKK